MYGRHFVGTWQRLAIVAGLLAFIAALAMLNRHATLAQDSPFTPKMLAAFNGDELRIALMLPPEQRNRNAVDIVTVVDANDKALAQMRAEKVVAGAIRYTCKLDKAKANGASLVCARGGQRVKMALDSALLVKGHETSLQTGQQFFAGSTAPFQLDVHGVRNSRETVALPNSRVEIHLQDDKNKSHELWKGKTDDQGNITGNLHIPELPAGRYVMRVVTRSALGEETLQQNITLKAGAKILLISDKPIYQPGQTMHLRALALRPFDLKPVANTDVVFEVEDPKGNKVFKRTLKASDFGVASIDFELASEVNMGDYNIRAIIGQNRAEKTVAVKRYVLPKFKINVKTDKKFYLPKETVKVELQTDYFFGKPVAAGKVKVTAETFDIQFRKFAEWQGKTDKNGHVKFEIKLPDYFVGQPIQQGNALVKLDVQITDTADHSQKVTQTRTVSAQPIRVSLIPEGGKLVPEMKNRIFVAAVYPDGSPAECQVVVNQAKVSGKDVAVRGGPLATVKTNESGLAEFELQPELKFLRRENRNQLVNIEGLGGRRQISERPIVYDVQVRAQDKTGNKAEVTVTLNSEPLGENILLRLDKAIYKSAEKMQVDIRTSAKTPTVYLDIVRGGQIVLSKWLDVKDGRATHQLDLPQDVFGSLEVHAYQVINSGVIVRDSRVVYAHPRNDLNIKVQPSKSEFRPGENGRIQFHATDKNGKGTAAALGVLVVDEAVYALQDMQPGLEKVYFTLQKELLQPRAQAKEVQPPGNLQGLIRQPALPAGQQQIARALLTSVKVQPPERWQVTPAKVRRIQFYAQVQHIGWGLYRYAWFHDQALQFDEKKGRWDFRPNALQDAVEQNMIYRGITNDPAGGTITLASLQKTEKGFDVDKLTSAITHHRMAMLAMAVEKYANAHKKELNKNSRWKIEEITLLRAAQDSKLDQRFLRDAWGQGFRFKPGPDTSGNIAKAVQIVSAGPDRDYQTQDDVVWTADNRDNEIGGWWSTNLRNGVHPDVYTEKGPRQDVTVEALEELGLLVVRGRDPQKRMELERQFDQNQRFNRFNNLRAPMNDAAMPRPGGFAGRGGRKAGAKGGQAQGLPQAGGDGKVDRAGEGAATGPSTPSQPGAPKIRVREYFPETMLWQPQLITDDNGVANMSVNFADSITTWRLSASANSRGGALGSMTTPLKVFQDFFVDIDLPVTLTQNDEVAFPVAVYNYLKTPQTVKLELQKGDWFNLLDTEGFTRKIDLKPNEVTAVHFRVKAHRVGWQSLMVKAFGSKKNDAVRRVIEVVPDGKKYEAVVSDRLKGKVAHRINIPKNAIPDSSKLLVRIYPGVMAQVMEGMEGMLRLPGG